MYQSGTRFFLWILLLLGLAAPAFGQVTSSNLRGTVLDASGHPVQDAEVNLEFPAAQLKKSAKTNASGQFAFTGLRVGGPYNIKASKSGMEDAKREGVQLNAGNNEGEVLTLGAKSETVKVTANRQLNTSAKSDFFASDIKRAPSAKQDLKDIIRATPNAVVDGTRMSVGGANNRFNSITVDGMRQDDSFGLNGNGYPTQRSPVSLQSVEEISVDSSPFDVRYGNFLGGGVNVVTKSGTDEFQGSVMVTRTTDGLQGRKTKDLTYKSKYEENRVGLSLGGPIIPEKLHFFANIENLQSTTPSTAGPLGSGAPVEVSRVTFEEMAEAQEISSRVYGFDAGVASKRLKEKDFKGLLKLDYTINEDQRLEFKYQRAQGNNINAGFADPINLPLTSFWYDRTDTMDTGSLRLFSDWKDGLSTKVGFSTKKVTSEQEPLNGNGFMEANIRTPEQGVIKLGPDRSRHKNELRNNSNIIEAEANYLMDEHLLTGGVNVEKVDIWNLFVASSNGVATYDNLADFEAKIPSQLSYSNAYTNNADDAAADWGYSVNTLYLQDEWQINPRLTARYGVRGEFYTAKGTIEENATFVKNYGFSNKEDISGKQSVLPRIGLSYKATDKLNLRGGFGLFGGGTPNVWLSNSYSNDGVTYVSTTSNNKAETTGFDGRNVPDVIKAKLQRGDGNVDALDPDFKIPQSWKYQMGANYRFDIPSFLDNIQLATNYSYTRTRYGITWRDLRRDNPIFGSINLPTGTAPDGRPIYDQTPGATTAGSEFNVNRGYDMLLTNTTKGYAHNADISLTKRFETGFNTSVAYAWQDVQEVNPGTSSVSASNYSIVAIGNDPNNPGVDRSIYETKHRILLTGGYTHSFFEDLASSIDFIFERRSGQPYSFTMGAADTNGNTLGRLYGESSRFASNKRMLFYVPRGDGSDVEYAAGANGTPFDEDGFNKYLSKYGLNKYRGRLAPRNAFFSDWVQKLDMRITQELPGFRATDRARLVFDLENLPNFLNKKWGQIRQVDFPYMAPVVDVNYNATTGKYVYSNFTTNKPDKTRMLESIWKLQLAAYYDF